MDRRFAHLYDWFSWFYPAFTRSGFALIGMSEGQGRRQVLDRLDPRGGRVLEVSIGPGSNLPVLLARPDVGEVHGLDISIGQLRRCRALVRRRGWPVPLYLASAEALPFRDATFDAVLHIGGINFFDDKAQALAEMARVAKPSTRVVVVDENERAARGYERTLPGFRSTFRQGRPPVSAPWPKSPTACTRSRCRTSGAAGSTASSSSPLTLAPTTCRAVRWARMPDREQTGRPRASASPAQSRSRPAAPSAGASPVHPAPSERPRITRFRVALR